MVHALSFRIWLEDKGLSPHRRIDVLPKDDSSVKASWFSEKVGGALNLLRKTFVQSFIRTPESQMPNTDQIGDPNNPRWKKLWAWVEENGGDMHQMKFLGKGQNGRAYKVGNLVLKLTGDVAEAKVASLVKHNNLPVTVIDIRKVSGWEPETYAILSTFAQQDRVSQNLKDAGIVIRTYLERNVLGKKDSMDRFAQNDDIHNTIDAIRKYSWLKQIRTMPYAWRPYSSARLKELIPYLRLILDVVHKIMGVSGMIWHDMHPDNLGNDSKGHLMLFDLGVSYAYKDNKLPKIEEI
jgi:hypothetical protein